MPPGKNLITTLISVICLSLSVFAADTQKKESTAKEPAKPSYELPQPSTETLDYDAYGNIRVEALSHSHVMEYASGLMDGIGSRLTGSPNVKKANEWTRDQFTAMGCVNAHLEDWGEFGMGWVQLNTWLRMTSPDHSVFIAQAGPWSPATKGSISGSAVWVDIKEEKDFDQYRSKLAGKIVLLGDMREVKPVDKPLFTRYDDAELTKLQDYPLSSPSRNLQIYVQRAQLREKVGKFLADEHAAAALFPSRDGENNGGSGGTTFDDNGTAFGMQVYLRDQANPIPLAVIAI